MQAVNKTVRRLTSEQTWQELGDDMDESGGSGVEEMRGAGLESDIDEEILSKRLCSRVICVPEHVSAWLKRAIEHISPVNVCT